MFSCSHLEPAYNLSNRRSFASLKQQAAVAINETALRQSFKQQANSDGTMDIPTFQMILKSLHLDPSDYAVHEAINEASSGLVIEEKDLARFLELLDRNQKNAKDLAVNLRSIFDLIDADKNGFLDR